MNHTLWEKNQYRLAALPTPQRRQAQAAYCDAWTDVIVGVDTEQGALNKLTKQIEQLELEGQED